MYVLKLYRLNEKDELEYIKNSIENFIQDMNINYKIDINIKKFDKESNYLSVYFTLTLYNDDIKKINRKNSEEKIKRYIKDIFEKFNYEYISSEVIRYYTHKDNVYIFIKDYSLDKFIKVLDINNIIDILKNGISDINIIYSLKDFILEIKHSDIITYMKFRKYYKGNNFNLYGIELTLNEFLLCNDNTHDKYKFEFVYNLNINNKVSIDIKYKDEKNYIELYIIYTYENYMKITYKDEDYLYTYTTKNNLIVKNFIHHIKKEIETYMFNNLINFLQGNKKMSYLVTKKHKIKDIINTIKVCDMLI